jgi:hydrogenase/urease accessory protein HupE
MVCGHWRWAARARWILLLGFATLNALISVHAHLMPAQQGTLNISGASVFVVLAVPASAVPGLDADGNGRVSPSELAAFGPRWPTIWSEGFVLRNGAQAGQLALVQAMPEVEHPPGTPTDGSAPAPDARYFVVMARIDFGEPPNQLTLRTTLFGTAPDEQHIRLRATRDPEAQVITLRPGNSAAPVLPTAQQTVLRYTALGIEHILTGIDHVLFVLALVLLGRGWRAWLWLLSLFTVAHSITLIASLRGWISWPSAWFEPLILASVVVMAAMALRRAWQRRNLTAPDRVAQRVVQPFEWVLVFGFGLLHGLGFAGSLTQAGMDGPQLWPAVLGFNLGVELGQVAIVAAALAAWQGSRLLRHVIEWRNAARG